MTDEEQGRDAFILIITFPLRLIGWIFWLILFIPRKIYTIIRSPKCIIILPILTALCYYRKDIVAMASPNAWEWLSSIYLWGGIAGIIAISLIFKSQDEKNRLAHEAIFAKVPPKFKNKIEGVDDENRISFRAIYEKDFPRFQS